MEIMELIGDDGDVCTGDISSSIELVGDGIKSIDELAGGVAGDKTGEGIYLITAKGASSYIPKDLNVGEALPSDGSDVLKVGDKVKKINLVKSLDVSGWSLNVTQSEVDVTLLKHKYKKYRPGKRDASGTLNMIFTLGATDQEGGLVEKMMKVVRKKADSTIEIKEADNKPLYFIGYVRKTDIPGETRLFMFARIYLYGISFGGQSESAQAFDCSFRLTGLDPVFYSEEIPL